MRRFNARNKKIKQAITDDYPKRVQSKFYRLDVFFFKKKDQQKVLYLCFLCVRVCPSTGDVKGGGGTYPRSRGTKKTNVDEKT